MPLTKTPVSWPLLGGLATKGSALSVQPGSHLQLDNVVQERADEWRRRNGFVRTDADTRTGFGMVAADGGGALLSLGANAAVNSSATGAASRWWSAKPAAAARVWDRKAIARVANQEQVGYASTGSVGMVATSDTTTTGPVISVFDESTWATILVGQLSIATRVRCAATATHLVAVSVAATGNLRVRVFDTSAGTLGAETTIKTGMHTVSSYLDAHYYGGSTITIVCRESASNQIRFIEYNPGTGALATDALLAVDAGNCLGLGMDPDASGTRLVFVSNATPSTRVLRVTSGGTILTDDQAEAVASTQIAGCAFASGADWRILYQTAAGVRQNDKLSGAVGTARDFSVAAGVTDIRLDSQAWRDTTDTTTMRVLLGIHSSASGDEQNSWLEVDVTNGEVVGRLMLLQASPALALSASLYQVQRMGSGRFRAGVLRMARFSRQGATVARQFSADVFTQTALTDSTAHTIGLGKPVAIAGGVVFPGSVVRISTGQRDATSNVPYFAPIGQATAPKPPALVAGGAGSLTTGAVYQYIVHFEVLDDRGNVWRGPPSIPSTVTLSGGNTSVAATITNWLTTEGSCRAVIFRTSASGSIFRRIGSFEFHPSLGTSTVYNDTAADSAITSGDILYTTGELPTALTPPASHVAVFGDRAWLVNGDFPTELLFSKNIRPGVQPEFCDEFTIDLDDDKGDITGIAAMDDKLVVFKRNAIYFVQGGETLGNNGQGQFPVVTRVDADLGAIVGSPTVSCGAEVYFVSDRGIYSIDRAANVVWVGEAVDQYLHQPLIQTPETVTDGVFVSEANEVRFTTTNYVLVYDRDAKTWVRWTGLAGMTRALVIGGRMVMFKASDGTVWREGDHTQLTDQGTAFTGVIRSAWIRPAGPFGRFRLYRALALATRTSGGGNITPSLAIYLDNSDTAVQTVSPPSPIAGATLVSNSVTYPRTQKCTAFSLALTLPSGDVTYRLDAWGALVGVQPAAQKQPAAQRWV